MAIITIKSGGRSAGLFAYRSESEDFAATVLVVPKLWKNDPYGAPVIGAWLASANGRTALTVILPEHGEVSVTVGERSQAERASLEHAISLLSKTLDGRRKRWKAKVRRDRKASEHEEVMPDADNNESVAKLERFADDADVSVPVDGGLRFNWSSSQADSKTYDGAAFNLTERLRDLLWLRLRADNGKSSASDGGGAERDGLLIDPTQAADHHLQDPLALLAELDFVSELNRLQHRIRKGYVPEEDRLSAIRGRITDRGVLDYEMTGIPLLECRFDEFVEATPLFRVLVTALDVVASGALRASLGVGSDWFGGSADLHPAALREQLRNIPSFPLPVARATAERLRLTRLQHEWQRPLDLAKRILRAESVATAASDDNGGVTVWSMEMPALWEQILAGAIDAQSDWTIQRKRQGQKVSMPPPWPNFGHYRTPDLLLRSRKRELRRTMILDAKYAPLDGTPSIAYQNQMFVYSLLAENPPEALALVYPVMREGAVARRSDSKRHSPLNVERSKAPNASAPAEAPSAPVLYTLEVPFPGHREVSDGTLWSEHLKRIGTEMMTTLTVRPTHAG
jgi:hypothetical protein